MCCVCCQDCYTYSRSNELQAESSKAGEIGEVEGLLRKGLQSGLNGEWVKSGTVSASILAAWAWRGEYMSFTVV